LSDSHSSTVRTAVARLATLRDDATLVVASTSALPITPPADVDWLIEAALTQPRTLAAPLGCSSICDTETALAAPPAASSDDTHPGANATSADVGIYLALDTAAGAPNGGVRAATSASAGGRLHVHRPACRVPRFAHGGLLAAKWGTFRALHAAMDDGLRARLGRTLGHAGDVLAELPVAYLYSLLAAALPLAAPAHNEVVALTSLHLLPESMGRCPCAAFERDGLL
jgi:hypothetical protein